MEGARSLLRRSGIAMSPRDLILALFVVTVWGVNFVAIRWGVD